MSLWDSIVKGWEGLVRVATAVGNTIIKATQKTIDFVYDISAQVAGRIAHAARAAFNSFVEDVVTLVDGVATIAIKVIDAAGNIVTKLITKPIGMYYEIKRKYRDEKARYEAYTAQTTEETQSEVLNSIFLVARGLEAKANEVRNKPEMQNFGNFARLRVSGIFLQDLLSQEDQIESSEEINLRFLEHVKMFLLDNYAQLGKNKNKEILEFDALIKKIYNKSLLVIGAETLVDFWKKQEIELDAKRKELAKNSNELKQTISMYETHIQNKLEGHEQISGKLAEAKRRLAEKEKELETAYNQYLDNRDIGGASENMLYVMNHEATINKRIIKMGENAGTVLVKWQAGHTPSNEERAVIQDFNLVAKGEQKSSEEGTQL